MPPRHVDAIGRMADVLRNARANGAAPRFVLPPPEYWVADPDDEGGWVWEVTTAGLRALELDTLARDGGLLL